MVLTEIVKAGLDAALGFLGLHGIKVGMVAAALVVIWHGRSLLAALQRVTMLLRIGFLGAALVALLLIVAFGMGWISVELPVVPVPGL